MAAKKKSKKKASRKAKPAKRASGLKTKKAAKKTAKRSTKKTARRPAKKAKKTVKAAARKAPARKAKKTAKKKKQTVGEGDYAASRAFLKDQSSFVEKNRADIPAMGRQAEKDLDGPQGEELREAEASAAGRSRDTI
jgi:hypothetical protein